MVNPGPFDPSRPRPPLVEIAGLARRFGGGVAALDGVDLVIGRGELVAVLGPSGCGKSTLLNLVAGLDKPTAGTITVGGARVDTMGEAATARFRRTHIGMVFQFFNLLDDLTVRDNVLLPAQLAGADRAEASTRADSLLDRLGVARHAGVYPGTLSGGERQRVAIARALINRPAVVLADEPAGALDTASGQRVADLLREINAAGQTVVLVTHDRSMAQSVAIRTIEMLDGRVRFDSGLTGATR